MTDFSFSNNVLQDFPASVDESFSKQIVNQLRGNTDERYSPPYTETANVQTSIYDFIGKNTYLGHDVPGFHAVDNHNLKVGDSVLITNNNNYYAGEYTVVKTSADDGTYNGTIFLIDTPFAGNGSGTFKKTDSTLMKQNKNGKETYFAKPFDDLIVIPKNTNPITFYGNKYLRFGEYIFSKIPIGIDAQKFLNDSGEDTNGYFIKAYNDFINSSKDYNKDPSEGKNYNKDQSQTDSTGPSNITYYVIGGVALLSLILILRK